LQDFYINLNEIAGHFSHFNVLSQPTKDWTGKEGYVQNVLLDLEPNLENAAVYACGSDAMIKSARVALLDAGLSSRQFYFDAFVSTSTD
jgi:CDP-4-dehydro-6-deoxyglucose reductase